MKAFVTLLALLTCFEILGQEKGSFTDPRDGTTYATLTYNIGGTESTPVRRTWFATNLNYEVENSFCYKDMKVYCENFGRIYNYSVAVDACPEGWRVPTAKDWFELFALYGGREKAGEEIREGGSSGLNLAYTGFGEPGGYFHGVGIEGYYWDAEEQSGEEAGVIIIHKGSSDVFHDKTGKHHRNAVRCIKRYE